jgi:hypothetical protein
MGAWVIGRFCTGLRGEEMHLIELAGMANSLVHMDDVKNPHFLFVVSGCTKVNQLSKAKSFEYKVLPLLKALAEYPVGG